jgi:hypothetical protein
VCIRELSTIKKELLTDMHGKARIKNKGKTMKMKLKRIKIRERPWANITGPE